MCDKSRNTWLCVHWQWNTLEWCQLNARQAKPGVHLVTPLSCVSLSMNTQPSVPTIGPFNARWSRGYIHNASYYHHQIGCINLSHWCHSSPWLCAWGACTFICCRFHIYPEEAGFCFFMMCTNYQVHYGQMVVFVCLHITLHHYHHYRDALEWIKLLKCLPGTFFRVCV